MSEDNQIFRDLEIFQTNSGKTAGSVLDAIKTKTIAGKEFMRNKLTNAIKNLYDESKNVLKPTNHLLDWETLSATEHNIRLMDSFDDKTEEFYSNVYLGGKLSFLNSFTWFMTTMIFYTKWILPTLSILVPIILVIIIPIAFLSGWFNLDMLPIRYKDMIESLFSDQLRVWMSKDTSEFSWFTRLVYICGTAFVYGSAAWTQIVASYKISHVCVDIREQIMNFCKYTKAAGYYSKEIYNIIPELETFDFVRASIGQITVIFWRLRCNIDKIKEMMKKIGQADCETTIYNLLENRKICQAKFSKSTLKIKNVYHPTLEQKCVYNNISFTTGKPIIITGPNKGGKSTILKSIGINLLFSHVFGIAFGTNAIIPRISHLETYINMYDINGMHSLFETEVERYCSFIKTKEDKGINVLLVDEIFHSTNPIDGLTASEIILDKICTPKTMAIITTHYKELTKKGKAMSVESIKENNKIKYTYKLKEGINEESSVFDILSNYGLKKPIRL